MLSAAIRVDTPESCGKSLTVRSLPITMLIILWDDEHSKVTTK